MSREIKCMAWDKTLKVMAGPFVFGQLVGPTDAFEFLQYTGLRDKNGKEIYEGHILCFDPREWGSSRGNKWAVSWCDEAGCWDTGGGTNQECSEWKQVIGNIYEHPELLEKEQ